MNKVCIVTGGTSGIGLACAKLLSEEGCRVYTVSRRGAELPFAASISADVTDEQAVREVIARVYEKEKRLDIVVCCAGFGISGALEFTKSADAHRQMEVNLFGIDNVSKAAIPLMREQGGGQLIFISSVAGVVSIPFQGWYSVSKAAINAYTLALGNELRDFGISVSAVMPGDIRTGFTATRNKSEEGDDIYSGRISRSVSHMERDELSGMPPEAVAKQVVRLTKKKHPKPLSSAGFAYKAICCLVKLLPVRFVNRMVYMLYCK
jgi:NAD(P)-dependent dehydrogenase (short-subunit alcohol dehydrogenase family)